MQVLISRLFVVVRIHPTETRAQTSLEWDFDKFMAVNSALVFGTTPEINNFTKK